MRGEKLEASSLVPPTPAGEEKEKQGEGEKEREKKEGPWNDFIIMIIKISVGSYGPIYSSSTHPNHEEP